MSPPDSTPPSPGNSPPQLAPPERRKLPVVVRPTTPADFPAIIELTKTVYPGSPPWSEAQLGSHLEVFPEGQLVAVEPEDGKLVGMAASLVIPWSDYDLRGSWREFTAEGTFRNHDLAHGRTLYGAEVMVDPEVRRRGVGRALYRGRRRIVERLGLLRIRAGARMRGYGKVAERLTPEQYAIEVARGERRDPTLSFQLREGFAILAVVPGYLRHDPESAGHAALIEWLNPAVATPVDAAGRDPRFLPPPLPSSPAPPSRG